ncbi:hypothetical protein GGF46_002142 [Coemansia sp. RSA 552]|nr:hypothetical protein GGF46_002142 [Coemansia sp. RSA 552]
MLPVLSEQQQQRFGLTSAAALALGLSLAAALVQLLASDDPTHCVAAQRRGWWADRHELVWQPDGCTLKQYTSRDVAQCVPELDHALFIGDSSVRNKFHAYARLVDPSHSLDQTDMPVHANLSAQWPDSNRTAAEFVWDPFLNSTTAYSVLRAQYNETLTRPWLLVLGTGSWYLRYAEEVGGVPGWRRKADVLAQRLASYTVYPGAPDSPHADHVFVSPVNDVVPELLSAERRDTIDPEGIRWMNMYLEAAGAPVFPAWGLMTQGQAAQSTDGLHYSDALEDRMANLLLNRVCNRRLLPRAPPFRATCCLEYPAPSRIVLWTAVGSLVLIPLLLYAHGSGWLLARVLTPAPDTLRQMLVFGAILLLAFVCDRTPLFAKLQKTYVGWVFGALMATFLVAGGGSWREDGAKATGFLNRAQTDEWKGWMQLIILAYHLLNASTVAGIYNPVRVLVGMYLFMTGYGHCCFFVAKGDFGLRRLTAVLLRTNVLAVSLAFVMGSSYMDYYFAPLSSVWVLVVWATLYPLSRLNRTRLVWAKLAVSAVLVVAINRMHLWPFGVLEQLGVGWSQREWEFRFGLDIANVYAGMALALVSMLHGEALVSHPRWPQLRRWGLLASAGAVLWYFAFELTRADKYVYNQWHPLVSPLPIVGFVMLRNATAYLRSHSSAAFRWAGVISLELFIAQFHLFLAADTKGVLVLVHPRLWFTNFAAISLVFAGLCRLLATASGAISKCLMAPILDSPREDGIPMTELGTSERPRALDRLAASDPPPVLRALRAAARAVDHLAVRWVLGLSLLAYLNNHL